MMCRKRMSHLSKEFVQGLQGALRADDEALVWMLLADVHAADVADILEVLSLGQRKKPAGITSLLTGDAKRGTSACCQQVMAART